MTFEEAKSCIKDKINALLPQYNRKKKQYLVIIGPELELIGKIYGKTKCYGAGGKLSKWEDTFSHSLILYSTMFDLNKVKFKILDKEQMKRFSKKVELNFDEDLVCSSKLPEVIRNIGKNQ